MNEQPREIGKYTIEGELGVGGMGTVYKAKDPNGNIVALKMLHKEMLEHPRIIQKFFNEAIVLAKLEHENITKLLEFFPEGNNYAIVMEYVEGITLKDLMLEHDGLIPYDQALSLAKQILEAFQFAHEKGIIHRDIKPANIMVVQGGSIKVMDFGIAKLSTSVSQGTSKWGTLCYSSPERFKEDRVIDRRADIYSLGIMFYEMFAGRKPYNSDDDGRIIYCHFHEIPDPPKDSVESLPDVVNRAILKSLEKEPDNRFSNCQEYLHALDRKYDLPSEDITVKTVPGSGPISGIAPDPVTRTTPLTASMQDKMRSKSHTKESMFVLEVARFEKKLKVSGYERSNGDERPVKGYNEVDYNESKIKEYTKEITGLLNRANRRGKISSDLIEKLKDLGKLMFDELLPGTVKEKIIGTSENNLMISIDDNLVYIPWELLYDGQEFLCLRFSLGRSVSTQQEVAVSSRSLGIPLKMQLLADPGGDLANSYSEGVEIKNEIGQLESMIDLSMKSTDIKVDHVKAKIRNFDIVHYAGHAEHDSEHPEKSGWLLSDGILSAEDIIKIKGAMPMPSLVFSNACQSAQTDEWNLDDDYGDKLFGLANAFLLSGVQHYIGTFWEIPDEAGAYFAVNFYRNIADGISIGEALRKARVALIKKYWEDNIVWANYILYGDPTTVYVLPEMTARVQESEERPAQETPDSSKLRHKEEVVSLLGKKKVSRNMIYAGTALLLIAILAVFIFRGDFLSFIPQGKTKVVVTEKPVSVEEKKAAQKRMDALVSSLAARYREGKFNTAKDMQDKWTGPLTMVLMDVQSIGDTTESSVEKLTSMLPLALQREAGISMVEREILDKLLEELKLSTSALADPATALRLGKVLSAKIMITGKIIADGKGATVILRCIDTETTAVRKVISAESLSGDIDMKLINGLGSQLTAWARTDFPSQGSIREKKK